MKTISMILTLLVFALVANGQIKLTYENHAFTLGDKHDFIITQNVNEGKSGANVTWDFSGLVPANKNLTSNMLEPSATEKGLLVNKANLALEEYGNIFYFNVSKAGMEQYGSSSGNSLAIFNKPFVKMKYPFLYGDVVTGDYSGVQETENSKMDITGIYKLEGDAWGTVILPNGIYTNTLRVKQTRTYKYNNGAETKEITYRWYALSVRYPILVIIKYENNEQSSVVQVAYFAHYTNDNLKSINNQVAPDGNQEIVVSPNPFDDFISVNYSVVAKTKVSIDLYNASGIMVARLITPLMKEPGEYTDKLSISSGLATGNYYIKITVGSKTNVKKVVKV